MRALHINCNYIGTTLHQLMIEKLDQLGIENQVFVPTYDKTKMAIIPNNNVYISECFKKWSRLVFNYKQHKIRKAVEEHYDIGSFDLIHAYTLFTDGNTANILSKKYNKPYVVAVRNTDVNSFFKWMPHLRKRGIRLMREAAAVFFLSASYKNFVFKKYVPEEYRNEIDAKTHIIPNGIDDFWHCNPPEGDKTVTDEIKLIYAGRIDKNKNIPTIQKAMRILREQGYSAKLTVVGKVVDKNEFAIIQKDAYTKYIPALQKQELIDVYRTHTMFVMPSFTESFGLVYAEAMSQGLPVIYTRGEGFDGQFADGTVGYAVSPDNPAEIADKIEKIVGGYNTFPKICREKAGKFNWADIANEYERIYEEIVNGV